MRKFVIEHKIKITGDQHQYSDAGVPLFSDNTVGFFSYRGWGDFMAAVWSTEENINYNWDNGWQPKGHLTINGKNTRDLHGEEVLLVFKYRQMGYSQYKIANILNTSRNTIARITQGKTYLEYQKYNTEYDK